MSETIPKGPVGNNPNTSNNDSDPVDQDSNLGSNEDTVKYSTYKKSVSELRNLRSKNSDLIAELAQYQAGDKQRKEDQLKADRKFDEILISRDNELQETRTKLIASEKDKTDFVKITNFLGAMGEAKIDPKYYGFIPTDTITMDENNTINQESLIGAVNDFKAEHPSLLINRRSDLPANRVGDSTGKGLSVSEWRSLKSSKEQMNRYDEVNWETKP